MEASIERQRLEPHDAVTLKVRGTETKIGHFSHKVVLMTNMEGSPHIMIPVRGFLDSAVCVERPFLKFEGVMPGDQARAELDIDLFEGVEPADVFAEIPDGAPVRMKVLCSATGEPRLEVTWEGASEPGWYRYPINLQVECIEASAAAPLHVAVHVVPSSQVVPMSLLIRESELAGTWSRCLKVQLPPENADDVLFEWSSSDFGRAIEIAESSDGSSSTLLALAPTASGSVKSLAGRQADLIVSSGSGAVRHRVPVYIGLSRFLGHGSTAPTVVDDAKLHKEERSVLLEKGR